MLIKNSDNMKKKKKLDIGLDVKKPKDTCVSDMCPWHGHLKVRGRVFKGTVISDKSARTAIVEWHFSQYITKYERYERRKTKIAVHNPQCINAKHGDLVTIAECRPLTKTKKFVIVESTFS